VIGRAGRNVGGASDPASSAAGTKTPSVTQAWRWTDLGQDLGRGVRPTRLFATGLDAVVDVTRMAVIASEIGSGS
jgi:hypothetical protein